MSKVYIFSNGTQFADWTDRNCDRCKKGASVILEPHEWPTCEIEYAIGVAYIGSGKIDEEIAKRAGVSEETKGCYTWECNEYERIE